MNLLLRIHLIVALIAGLPLTAPAEDPPAKPQWNVVAECQMVTLPQKSALLLIPELSDQKKFDEAWAKVQAMIGSGEATLVANLLVQGEAGKKLVSESIEEVKYPTEFEGPQLPHEIPKEKAVEFMKSWPVVGITPTAFETRNIGVMLDVLATVSRDGQWIRVSAIPQHVRLLRFLKFDAGVLPTGRELSIEQPQFSSLKDTVDVVLHAGQRILIGTHKVPGPENVLEFFFLRVRTEPVANSP